MSAENDLFTTDNNGVGPSSSAFLPRSGEPRPAYLPGAGKPSHAFQPGAGHMKNSLPTNFRNKIGEHQVQQVSLELLNPWTQTNSTRVGSIKPWNIYIDDI